MINTKRLLALAGSALAAILCATSIHAQAQYPDRPIKIMVPFAASGSIDIVARTISDPLGKALGKPVIVDNKPGASGMIGSQQVATAKPDGYTLLANSSIHVIVPSLYGSIIQYDAIDDFIPVSQITLVPLILVASEQSKIKTFADLEAYAKEQKQGLSYATAGNGSTPHIAGEMLGDALSVPVVHVPYKGSGAAMVDVMGGQVPIMFDALTAVMGPIKSGKLIPVAIAAAERSPALPDVPTFAELGHPDFDLSTWHGIWAPAGTPQAIVDRLSEELQSITHLPDTERKITNIGGMPVGNTPEEFLAFSKQEFEKWRALIEKYDIKID